ncbi:DsbA family protein [Pseudophaeobacter sp.]|uniref:DsbA family protein n=1 Tax=Pseudophaeobacter sp. TaxID=1971739 RepID=UPI00405A3478
MAALDFYFSTLSPYAYLAGTRLEEMAARQNVRITYKPLDILALFARTGGTSPKERHVSRQEYRLIEMQRQATKLGMDINLKPSHWPTNAAPSSYAIVAAQSAGGGDMGALVHGLLRAVWAEERDIAQDEVIKSCLTSAGFDAELAESGLLAGAQAYAQNLEDAVKAGVFGAPFYVTEDGARFWGQDRIADLEQHLSG